MDWASQDQLNLLKDLVSSSEARIERGDLLVEVPHHLAEGIDGTRLGRGCGLADLGLRRLLCFEDLLTGNGCGIRSCRCSRR